MKIISKILGFIILLSIFYVSCKNEASLAKIENEEKFENKDQSLAEDASSIIDITDYILTGIAISDIVIKKVEDEEISQFVKFLHQRNEAIFEEIDTVTQSLGMANIVEPSELRATEIESIYMTESDEEAVNAYSKWLKEYANHLKDLSKTMIQESSHSDVIRLGSQINAYGNAVQREMLFLEKRMI